MSSGGRVVMVVGAGGREHALARRLAQSRSVGRVLAAPGNGGTEEVGTNVALGPAGLSAEKLAEIARRESVDLVVVGPERPLCDGLADELRAQGIPTFGPGRAAARLEGSKAFMKRLAARQSIPTAPFEIFDDAERAAAYIRAHERPLVIKADGLCAGKGVVVAEDHAEAEQAARAMLSGEAFGDAGRTIVVEECIEGWEASVHAICDGTRYFLLPSVQDHKRLRDHDQGPNTGGMGAYGPTPLVLPELEQRIAREIIEPALAGMAEQGTPFAGTLFAGVMVDAEGTPLALEYNVRFGDPETEVLMDLLEGDLGEALAAAAEGRLDPNVLARSPRHAIAVVLAAEGYPADPRLGDAISGVEAAAKMSGVTVLHAGTRRESGKLLTAGGRVLVVTATSDTLHAAREAAYEAADVIQFRGKQLRYDIAARALGLRETLTSER
jgi:phosphoribosylamine--glycine ligase